MNNFDNKALYSAQEKFLEMIGNSESLGFNIVLCGGTALARAYLHHRISYDLDFFVDGKFDPERLAFLLGRRGIQLSDIQIESGTHFVHQLFGFYKIDEVLSNHVKYDSLTKKSSAVLDMEFKVNELEARLRELSRRESLNTNKQDTTLLELVIR